MPLPFSITVLSSVCHYALVVCGEGGGAVKGSRSVQKAGLSQCDTD